MPLYSVRWILMSHRSSNTVPDDNMAYEAKQIQCFRQQNVSSGCPRSADPPSQFKSKAQEPYKGQKEQGEVALGSPANSNIDRASKDWRSIGIIDSEGKDRLQPDFTTIISN